MSYTCNCHASINNDVLLKMYRVLFRINAVAKAVFLLKKTIIGIFIIKYIYKTIT